MKRIFDIVFSSIGLLIAAPVLLLISVLLYIDSPGPVIFSQKRIGKGGKIFNVHKFRKFPPDWGDKGPGVTVGRDARMTRFGAFLERTKLDELPQLWNILVGDMSLVGPRPESLRYRHLFKGEYADVLGYTPGIFGPNQIAYRNESRMYPIDQDPEEFYALELFPRKAQNDIKYFKKSNLLTDFGLITKGFFITLLGAIDWKKSARTHLLPVLFDILLIELAWICAFYLRFDTNFMDMDKWFQPYLVGTWLIPLVVSPMLLLSGVYSRPIRYFSLSDARILVVALSMGWIAAQFILLGVYFRGTSIGVGAMGLFLAYFLLMSPRLLRRDLWHRSLLTQSSENQDQGVLIFGTNRLASALSVFIKDGLAKGKLTGFIEDNDPNMLGRRINGTKVLGTSRDLVSIFQVKKIEQLWLCADLTMKQLERVHIACDKFGVKVITVAEIDEFCDLLASEHIISPKEAEKLVAN